MNRLKAITIPLAALFLISLGTGMAFCDIMTFDLAKGNIGGLNCCTGPFADVTVERLTSTTATITFDSLVNGGYLYLLAGHQAADLNVNSTSFAVGTITGTNSIAGFTPGPYSTGSGNVSSFGTFNLTVDSFGGFTDSATKIVIALTDLSGTWASASDVLAGNNDGAMAAIHGFACAEPACSVKSGAAFTGYASNVPEPSSLSFLGLAGMMTVLCIFRRQAASRA